MILDVVKVNSFIIAKQKLQKKINNKTFRRFLK